MIRLALALAVSAVLLADTADAARKRRYYKIVKVAPKPLEPETRTVRIIPIKRWDLWCARIGGAECPYK